MTSQHITDAFSKHLGTIRRHQDLEKGGLKHPTTVVPQLFLRDVATNIVLLTSAKVDQSCIYNWLE